MDMRLYLSDLTNKELFRMYGELPERRIEDLIDQEEHALSLDEAVRDSTAELEGVIDEFEGDLEYVNDTIGAINTDLKDLASELKDEIESETVNVRVLKDLLSSIMKVTRDLDYALSKEWKSLRVEPLKDCVNEIKTKLKPETRA